MPTTNFNIDYFIAKFTAIPDEKWTVGEFVDAQGRRCALGHCGVDNDFDFDVPAAAALKSLVRTRGYIPYVNDARDARYQQPTPKARILAFLRDVKTELETNPS